MAAAEALAELARMPVDAETEKAYGGAKLEFGKDYVIPKPFDKRLMSVISSKVAQAAIETGVARRTIDIDAYRKSLEV